MPDISKWNIFNTNEDNINNFKSFIDYNLNHFLKDIDISLIFKEQSFIKTNYDNDLYLGTFSLNMPEVEPNSIKKK